MSPNPSGQEPKHRVPDYHAKWSLGVDPRSSIILYGFRAYFLFSILHWILWDAIFCLYTRSPFLFPPWSLFFPISTLIPFYTLFILFLYTILDPFKDWTIHILDLSYSEQFWISSFRIHLIFLSNYLTSPFSA